MNEQNLEQFELYLSDKMSVDDKKNFEIRLTNEPDLQAELNQYQETTAFLETKFSAETAKFKQNLKAISTEHQSDNQSKKVQVLKFNPKYFAVAASLVLFFGLFFYLQTENPVYTDYNQHETAAFVERSGTDKTLLLAQKAFNEKQYQKAIPLFETVLKSYKKPEVIYFYAICLIETDNFAKAEDILLSLKEGNSIYNHRATWYLALMRLKQNNKASCKNFLKQIPVDAEDYTKAQELLELL